MVVSGMAGMMENGWMMKLIGLMAALIAETIIMNTATINTIDDNSDSDPTKEAVVCAIQHSVQDCDNPGFLKKSPTQWQGSQLS